MNNTESIRDILYNKKPLSASEIKSLDAIDDSFRAVKARLDLQRANKRKARLLSAFATITVFFIGFVCHTIFNYLSDIRENERISQLAQEQISRLPSHNQGIAPEAQAYRPVITEAVPLIEFELEPPGSDEPAPETRAITPKIQALRERFDNDDIVAHIEIEGTAINYMVAQSANNEYYLNHDIYGQSNSAGTIFMDYECNPADLSRNTVIYGHNMRNGSMFHNIRYYSSANFFNENKYIRLTTLHEDTVWEVFAFYVATTGFDYIRVDFQSEESFAQLIDEMLRRSIHDTEVEVTADDHILTLSTCQFAEGDTRYVLNAKLITRTPAEELTL